MTYVQELKSYFKSKPIFTIRDIQLLFQDKKLGKNYLHLMVHSLLKKNELHKITQGIYSFQEDSMLYGFAFSPFYYGLQNALALHGIGTQETNSVIVTPRKVRLGLREINGTHIVLHRIQRKLFFGFNYVKYYDWEIPVSDLEKTFLDFIYFRQPLTNEVKEEFLPKLNKKRLQEYLKKFPKITQKQFQNALK